MNAKRAVNDRCPWSIRNTDTWTTSRETCFLCFVQHGAQFWKCLWDNFGLSKWKPLKKFSNSYLQRRKLEKRRQLCLCRTNLTCYKALIAPTFRPCLHGVGDPGLVGKFLLFCVPQSVKTKETYPTRPGSPTPCKQALKEPFCFASTRVL